MNAGDRDIQMDIISSQVDSTLIYMDSESSYYSKNLHIEFEIKNGKEKEI